MAIAADADAVQLDDRDARALTECMTVLPYRDTPDWYGVVTESGSHYAVDARHGACDCADARHRDVYCKHQRRVDFATGERQIPEWADRDAVDPQLGEQVRCGTEVSLDV